MVLRFAGDFRKAEIVALLAYVCCRKQGGQMKVAELIAELRKADPESEVTMMIGNPNDTAYTDDVRCDVTDGIVEIVGWVASDNDAAFFPDEDTK